MRNRVMFLTGLWSGMRVGEIASLSVGDERNTDGKVKAEIRLIAAQTKGRQPRTVFLPQKLLDELQTFLDQRGPVPSTNPLFITAGRKRFSANVMAQHFHYLFKHAGIAGGIKPFHEEKLSDLTGRKRHQCACAGRSGWPPKSSGHHALSGRI